jgi:preprotein translocase subunit SecD
MSRFKEIATHWRTILLTIALILAIVSINPNPWQEGVAIRHVDSNSSAEAAGITSPDASISPRSREVITAVNNIPIENVSQYYSIVESLPPNETVLVNTDRDSYLLETQYAYNVTRTGENITRNVTEQVFNATLNETQNVTNTVTEPEVLRTRLNESAGLGITVFEAPTSNIRKGLDLTGGTRVILQPTESVSEDDMDILLENIQQRLNVFGLSDVIVRSSTDLQGNQFIIVEIAGATEEEVSELISRQGQFEARINGTTVFRGGDDITYVCRSADCSGIDPRNGCQQANGRWSCGFYFQINLAPEAAERQAGVTRNLSVVSGPGGGYLSSPLELYLDGQQVDQLQISASLQGRPTTDISITGGGNGTTRQKATEAALDDMKRLQTVLITGSLPVQLDIVRVDTISPILGQQFLNNALLIGAVAILAVALVVFLRYRSFVVSAPMVVAMLSEAVLILGVAALIGWNLDLAAIAGIIIAVGTGVDDQIVIADETLGSGASARQTWKSRMKNAFFIIFAAYFTLVVAMLPLWFAGAGMLRGFAITTILGVSVGVFITRPAYAVFVEKLSQD